MSPEELSDFKLNLDLWNYPDDSLVRKAAAHIVSQAAQIEALKEKLVEERAQVLAGKGNLIWEPLPDEDKPDGLYPALIIRGKEYWRAVARQQLKADPDLKKAGVEWE